jgi:hypothetical protein
MRDDPLNLMEVVVGVEVLEWYMVRELGRFDFVWLMLEYEEYMDYRVGVVDGWRRRVDLNQGKKVELPMQVESAWEYWLRELVEIVVVAVVAVVAVVVVVVVVVLAVVLKL